MNSNSNCMLHDQDDEQNEIPEANSADAIEEDGTPILDEIDLEENNLNPEEAEDIEWEDAQEEDK